MLESHRICCNAGNKGFLTTICDTNLFGMTVLLENSVKECVVRTSLAMTLVVTARSLAERRRCPLGLWMTDCIARTLLAMTGLLEKRVCLESGDGNPAS